MSPLHHVHEPTGPFPTGLPGLLLLGYSAPMPEAHCKSAHSRKNPALRPHCPLPTGKAVDTLPQCRRCLFGTCTGGGHGTRIKNKETQIK